MRLPLGIRRPPMIERRAMIGRTIRSLLGAALAIALAGAPTIAGGVGPPAGAIAMHGEPALPPDFDHLPYVNPTAAQRRRAQSRLSRRLRQPEPLQRQGLVDGAGPHRQRLSVADDALRRRAVHALRPHRQEHRNQSGARQGRLPSRSGRQVFGRIADHFGRRRVHLQPAQSQGPPAAARRLFAGQKHRRPGRPDRGL